MAVFELENKSINRVFVAFEDFTSIYCYTSLWWPSCSLALLGIKPFHSISSITEFDTYY